MGERVVVLVGTRTGLFLAASGEQRDRWQVRGPYCAGRQTMDVSWDPAGVYFGTNTGQVFGSRDDGDSWALVADYLPPALSVETAIVKR